MKRRQWAWWGVLVGTAWAAGCNGDGTQPPGPPADVMPSGGAGQNWYFNNPLPTPLRVTVVDLSGRPVPGVVVMWAVSSGAGAVSPVQSTTDASGEASTADSVGSSTIQRVSATVTGVPSAADFTEVATTPPTSAGVSLQNLAFNPDSVVVQSGGTVTWTWNDGAIRHNVTFTSGPARPPDAATRDSGTYALPLTTVGTYGYHCTIHATMMGSVIVVH
jgi:plastocyanin